MELYENSIYILKYYATCHVKSKDRFNIILGDEKVGPIIRTCINIMLEFYQKDPFASFGFLGSHSINKKKKIIESKSNTQRYRIYKKVMLNFFGTKSFAHSRNQNHSVYLMINKKNKNIRQFKKQAERSFSAIYRNLEF